LKEKSDYKNQLTDELNKVTTYKGNLNFFTDLMKTREKLRIDPDSIKSIIFDSNKKSLKIEQSNVRSFTINSCFQNEDKNPKNSHRIELHEFKNSNIINKNKIPNLSQNFKPVQLMLNNTDIIRSIHGIIDKSDSNKLEDPLYKNAKKLEIPYNYNATTKIFNEKTNNQYQENSVLSEISGRRKDNELRKSPNDPSKLLFQQSSDIIGTEVKNFDSESCDNLENECNLIDLKNKKISSNDEKQSKYDNLLMSDENIDINTLNYTHCDYKVI